MGRRSIFLFAQNVIIIVILLLLLISWNVLECLNEIFVFCVYCARCFTEFFQNLFCFPVDFIIFLINNKPSLCQKYAHAYAMDFFRFWTHCHTTLGLFTWYFLFPFYSFLMCVCVLLWIFFDFLLDLAHAELLLLFSNLDKCY